MFGIVINCLLCLFHPRAAKGLFARIQIAIETREIVAGKIDAKAMSGLENIARGAQINVVFVNLVRLNRLGLFGRIAIARAGICSAPCLVGIKAPARVLMNGNIPVRVSSTGNLPSAFGR